MAEELSYDPLKGQSAAGASQPSKSKEKPPKVAPDDFQKLQEDLERRLAEKEAELEKRFAQKEAELDAMREKLVAQQDSNAVRPIRPSEAVTIGEGYEFEVSPAKADSPLPTKKIRCCDESEAIRWYIVTTSDPDKPSKQVDPVRHPLRAKCLDEARRMEVRAKAHRAAMIRAKVARGASLSMEEEAEYEEAEAKRLGLIV